MQHSSLNNAANKTNHPQDTKNAANKTNHPQDIPTGKKLLDVDLHKKAIIEYFETSLYKP